MVAAGASAPESHIASLIPQTGVLAALAFLPTLLFYFMSPSGEVSSLTPGMMLACVVAIGAALLGRHKPLASIRTVDFAACVGLILFAIAAHFVIAVLNGGGFEPMRSALSGFVLVLALMGGLSIATVLASNDDSIDQAVAIVRGILIAFAILSITGIRLWPGSWEKPVFPFTEPSHFALMLNPFLAHAVFANKGIRRGIWLIVGLAIAYAGQSLTLLACVLAMGLMCMSLRGIAFFSLLVFVGSKFVELAYFEDRVNFGSDTRNISSLVYRQGWELLQDSIERTSGWGIGFQQLGYVPFNSPAADFLYSITRSDLNLTDGGFLLSKTVSEFGIVGVFMIAIYSYAFARALIAIRRSSRDSSTSIPRSLFFSWCVICSFSMDIIVRGLGYFSGQSLLFLSALCIMVNGRALLSRRQTQAYPSEADIGTDDRSLANRHARKSGASYLA
jgi:hypothetical protein